MKHDQAD
jgi:AP-1 complex subunit gamma-1